MMFVVVLGETAVVPDGLGLIPCLVMKHADLRILIGCELDVRIFVELVAIQRSFVEEELGMGVEIEIGVFGIVKGLESESSLV